MMFHIISVLIMTRVYLVLIPKGDWDRSCLS